MNARNRQRWWQRERQLIAPLLLLALLAHLGLFLNLPFWIQSGSALLLMGWLPATLLLRLLLGPPNADAVSRAERLLYIVGMGYGIIVLGMLGLSYVPGPIPRWLAFTTFDLLLFLLLVLYWRASHAQSSAPVVASSDPTTVAQRGWLLVGVLVLAIVGGFLRFPALGYAEFQGDEARAMLRAAEVIEGFDGSLFEHRKGPTEILLPAAPYVLMDRIDETAARLPFAVANFCALFGILLLGWRWFGPLAGWVAAMLLALDGYLIAFARIVQYQSIIFLTVVLVLLILQRLALHNVQGDSSTARLRGGLAVWLTLASFLLATGLLSHYEAILVLVPALLLLWQIMRAGVGLARLLLAALPAIGVGSAMLALFYIPFIRYPTFGNTFEYLAYKRIGEEFAYNNLGDYFIRSTLYSSTYAFGLMTLLAVAGLWQRYRRGLGRLGTLLGIALLVGVALTFWRPDWLTVAGTDMTWLFFVGALGLAILMPDRQQGERAVWLWFGAVLVLAIFFTATPNTHVYNFYFGWALVGGLVSSQLWHWLAPRRRWLAGAGAAVAATIILLLGYYEYSLFIRNDVEVLRTWPENRPRGYWSAYEVPIRSSIFGFPHHNGWKAVSVMAARGTLQGAFETNTKDWIVDWYTRGLGSCPRDQRYYILADKVEPVEAAAHAALHAELSKSHDLLATVEVQGQPRLQIYEQQTAMGRATTPVVQRLADSEMAAIFDQTLSQPTLAQSGRVANPTMERTLNFRLGENIELIGYTLHNQRVAPGSDLLVTLYWRAQTPITERYTGFVQLINPDDAHKAGQQDGEPVCGKYPTVDWQPGEIIADRYHVPIDPAAPHGTYGLLVGMYASNATGGDGENLTFYTNEGQSLGGSLSIDEVYVEPTTEQQARALR